MGIIFAAVTALAWGAWLAPTQRIVFKSNSIRIFHITLSILVFTFLVMIFTGGFHGMTSRAFFLSFLGGLIWSTSASIAFNAISKIGMARAAGIWSPLNIIFAMIWGEILFDELQDLGTKNLLLLLISIVIIIAGILMIIFARGEVKQVQTKKKMLLGLLGTLIVGFLWGTYFIPVKVSGVSMWMASFPMAVGMFAGGLIFNLITGGALKLPKKKDYIYTSLSGIFWAVGNYSMFLLVDIVGAGKGFTIAQLGIVVNAIIGIFWLRDPKPGTKAAAITFIGIIFATLGGIILGNLK